ncbi:MAG: aromatic ring-hydroxylating dioxygenase subunit alpha [bacterium]
MFTAEELAAVTAPLGSAKTLPPAAYTRPEIFDAELREVFYKEWICVAREEQLRDPGDYRSVRIGQQPLILVRQHDGSIHAMSAICPHRAMRIVSDHGNAGSFSCPYHMWKFDLDGRLISAPYMDNVDGVSAEGCRLRSARVDTWEGFVFVNLDPDASPLRQRLGQLEELVGGYRMGNLVIAASQEFDCPWNWKLLLENFMEAYHHIGPHLSSLQPTHKAKDAYVSGSVVQGWSVLHMPQVQGVGHEDGLPPIEGLNPRQKTETLASLLMPTCAWINTPSVAFWYELRPQAYNQMTLVIHTLLPEALASSTDSGDIAQLVQATIEHIHLEDVPVNQGPWQGLQAPLATQGPLSLLEEAIWQMNQWWLQRVVK